MARDLELALVLVLVTALELVEAEAEAEALTWKSMSPCLLPCRSSVHRVSVRSPWLMAA
jgi:hypothetical protein